MPAVPAPRDQWYVVQVLSGQETKVHENMKRRIESEEMSEYIYRILVPTEKVSEVRKGQKRETNRKFFPGYIIINMHLYSEDNQLMDKTWYFIQETPGVINFAGAKNRPMPMRKSEVDSLLAQMEGGEGESKLRIPFEVGETVRVADGPFESQTGYIEEIDPERGKLMVTVNIFGRETPVELETWQVEKAD